MLDKKVIYKELYINASKEMVYKCLTTPEHIVSYFPLEKVESNWTEGSSILFEGKESGKDIGKIINLVENEMFSFRYWNQNHFTKNIPQNEVFVNYLLKNSEGGTLLILKQSNLPSDEYFSIMNTVWKKLLNDFKVYVENK